MNHAPELIEYIDLLRSRGLRVLDPSPEIALHRADALEAAEMLRRGAIAILGGDVYHKDGAELRAAYDNWSLDQNAGETPKDYAVKSCLHTLDYVRSYPETKLEPVFVFVLGDESWTVTRKLKN
jgi:hypothetical protein